MRHVLVVDDNDDVGKVIADALDYHGYKVTLVDGGKAMRLILEGTHSIVAVVMDSNMPGESSASLAKYTKELRLPLVMVSGSPVSMKFAHDHDLQLLWKPFRIAELLTAVETAFESGKFGQRDA